MNATQIGARLRDLRAARELSLRQLAKVIGASPSLLSQIENGKVMPSVDTLYLLSGALGVPVAAFFGGASGEAATGGTWVVRAPERKRIGLEHGVTWENLLPGEESRLRFMEIRYPPGADSGESFLRHSGRDLFVVLAGELVGRSGSGSTDGPETRSGSRTSSARLRNEGERRGEGHRMRLGDDEGTARRRRGEEVAARPTPLGRAAKQ